MFSIIFPKSTFTIMVEQFSFHAHTLHFFKHLQAMMFQTFTNDSNYDPKTYVDLPLKFTLSFMEDAFWKLPRNTNSSVSIEDLKSFLEAHFEGGEDDLVYLKLEDFLTEPKGFLAKIKHPQMRVWALEVLSLWKSLSRKISGAMKAHPSLHILLPLLTFVVILGLRFREVY